MNTRILAFGDSIFWGAWDNEGGVIDRLKRKLSAETIQNSASNKYQVYNLGIGGNTSSDLLKRIESEIQVHTYRGWEIVVLLNIGKNDTRTNLSDTVPETSIEKFSENYKTLVKICKRSSSKILAVGLNPVAKEVVDFKEFRFHNTLLSRYNSIAKDIALQTDTPFLDTFDKVQALTGENLYHSDSIHFNDNGHLLLFASLYAKLFDLGFA